MEKYILTVDDEIHMLRLIEDLIIRKTDYRIITTHNALEVPEILEIRQFDIIITDLRMPGLSGLDIIRLIREKKRSETVIMITAFASPESAAEAFALGVFDYIIKPFRKERLLDTIERAVTVRGKKTTGKETTDMTDAGSFDKMVEQLKQKYLKILTEKMGSARDEFSRRSGLSQQIIDDVCENFYK